MTLTDFLVPSCRQMLRMLSGLLDKSQQQMPERLEALLSMRLAPDMFPLAAQLRFAAFLAQEPIFKLRGEAVPPWLEAVAAEGRNAGEVPGSIADARHRLDQALASLDSVADGSLDAGAGLPITIELPGSVRFFAMTGEEYVRDWALPQFYFHTVTAYAILRNQGVEIGKADYVPHMFAYLKSVG